LRDNEVEVIIEQISEPVFKIWELKTGFLLQTPSSAVLMNEKTHKADLTTRFLEVDSEDNILLLTQEVTNSKTI
jgi:hypothetical protein